MTSGISSPLRKAADGQTPVLITMPGGKEGYSERLHEMHQWMYERVGLKRFLQLGQPHDGLYFYFDDESIAREFAQRFQCELVEITNRLAS